MQEMGCPGFVRHALDVVLTLQARRQLNWNGEGGTDVKVMLKAGEYFSYVHICANRKQTFTKTVFLHR